MNRLSLDRRALAPVLVAIITLAALFVRLRGLGDQSLWVDEAMSVVFSSRPLGDLMQLLVTQDVHPPLYPVLLHYWMVLAGNGEFSARFPSALFGTALVPLIYLLGSQLEQMGRSEQKPSPSIVGLTAAALAASSAFYVGYSQQARNYMAVTFLGLLSSCLLIRALQVRSRWSWAAYGAATLAALYTHYTAFLLLAFHLLFVLLTRRSYSGAWKWWLLSIGVAGIAYLPWLGFSISQMERISDYWPGTLQLESALRTTLLEFVAGGSSESRRMALPSLLGAGLLGLGTIALLLGGLKGRTSQPALFLLLYLAVPAAILFSIAYFRPKFDPRYLILVTPAFYLILAWGIAGLLKTAGAAGVPLIARLSLPVLGLAALGAVVGVSAVYGEPARITHVGDGSGMAQEYGDYRALVSFLESRSHPGDAVVLMMNSYHPYVYYNKQQIPWYPMEPFDDFDGAIIRLNRMVDAGHKRLWFILWQKEWADPADYVMHVMEDQSKEVQLDASFQGLGLRLFELPPGQRFDYYPRVANGKDVNAIFGQQLEFWGWNLSAPEVQAGSSVQYDLHWRPMAKVQADLKGVVSVVDADQHVWARTDKAMATPFYPSSRWKVQEIIHDRYRVTVPPGTPPGSYRVELRLYDPKTMNEVSVARWEGAGLGTSLSLGTLVIRPGVIGTGTAAPAAPAATWEKGSDRFELLSGKLNHGAVTPGETAEITLNWRVPSTPKADYGARVALMDPKGEIVNVQTLPLVPGYSTSKWRPGEMVTSKYWVPVPPGLPTATYRIAAAPVAGKEEPRALDLAQVADLVVLPVKATFDLPAMQNRVSARLGDKAELAGYDMESSMVRAGGSVRLTIYWRNLGLFERSFKVFNHVIDDKNVFAGQRDGVPVGDTRPTTTWQKGEVVIDSYEIQISRDAKPGKYLLKTGMYAEEGGQRLPATGPDGAPSGDSVTLTTIEVIP